MVIDPRKTETAADFEWLGIAPDGDAFLLLSLLQVMFTENLVDRALVAQHARGVAWLEELVRPFTPESTQAQTGVDPGVVRQLARDLAGAEHAVVYGRVGTCLGQNGTLTTYLLDVVNLVAGHLGRVGGSMFGSFGIPGERFAMKAVGALLGAVYRRRRSRVGGSPRSSARNLPASWPKKSPRRAGGRSGHCSSARATPCSRCPMATS